jgi:deazaflavin-dependent oxidoreductase (nitroreductase family)
MKTGNRRAQIGVLFAASLLMSDDFDSLMSEEQYAYVTTTGRKTGLPRQIEIWFVEHDDKIYILAEHGFRTQWVKNILANPHVSVRIGRSEWAGTARVLDPEKDIETYAKVRELSREKSGWGEGMPVEIKRKPS